MVYQEVSGRIRVYAPKFYWQCVCGNPAGYIYRHVRIKIERDGFCKACDDLTTQHAEKNQV